MNSVINNWQSRPVRTLWFVVGGLILVSLEIILAFAAANWQTQLLALFLGAVLLVAFFWRPELLILFHFALAFFLPLNMEYTLGVYMPSTSLGEANFVLFDFILLGTLIIWIAKMLASQEIKLTKTSVDSQMGVLLLIVIVNLFVSLIKGNYLVGIFRDLRVFIVIFFYFYFTVNVLKDKARLRFFLKMAALLLVALACYQIYMQAQVGFPISARDNAFHNWTLIWYMWSLAILISFGLFRERKVVYFLAALLSLSFIALSYSKVWIAAVITGIVVSIIVLRKTVKPKVLSSTATIVVAIGALTLILLFVFKINPITAITNPVYKLFSWQQEPTILWRTAQIEGASGQILQDPVFGGGLGAFYQFTSGRFFEAKAATIENDYWWILFRLGFLGLGAFIWLTVSIFKRGVEALRYAKDDFTQPLALALLNCFVFLVCFFLGGSVLIHFRLGPNFGVMAGLIIALYNITKSENEGNTASLTLEFSNVAERRGE